jgi:hypothetical protein
MARLKIFLPLAVVLLACAPASAKPTFLYNDIEGQGLIFFCDLDGDHLKDAVLVAGLDVSIFYQDAKAGFPSRPQRQFRLDDRPVILWPVQLGKNFESLLLMTSDAVTELCLTNRTGPPVRQPLLRQLTVVPEMTGASRAMYFPLSAAGGTNGPLLLVPVPEGLQVWQHRDEWRQTQFIEGAVETETRMSVTTPGYTRSFELNLSLGDVNGDGRDDLIVRHSGVGDLQTFCLYLQNAEGRFTPEPVSSYTNQFDWRTDLYWVDVNRDGIPDLIKTTALNEPFFVPAMSSGKVLVGVHLADSHGRIPAEPQQVFRKNDWSPSLPIVDLDGDGFVDLVLGQVPLSTREGLRKAVIAEQVDLSLKFYFGRRGGIFPKEPDLQRDLLIRFEHEFLFNSALRLYYERYVSFNGDFNGDGKKDLLVGGQGDQISVYCFISREKGFSSKADFNFSFPGPIEWWAVEELNGDGVSDLIVKFQNRNTFRIFTSRKQ